MPKFTIINGTVHPLLPGEQAERDPAHAAEALSVLKDFLTIGDPAVQQAIADLIAALARIPV